MKLTSHVFCRKAISSVSLVVLMSLGWTSCKSDENFLELKEQFAGPIDVVYSDPYFYVLNSDFDQNNQGSIVVIDPEAQAGTEKKSVVKVPRMGRSLFQSDSWLVQVTMR